MDLLRRYIAGLNQRERIILVVGGFGALLMLLWALAVEPAFSNVERLKELTQRKLSAQQELAEVLAEYRQQLARTGSVTPAKPQKGFSLLSFLEGLSAKSHVKGNIKYMRPSTSEVSDGVREHSVEIKVANIHLDAVVNLLTAVERAPHSLRIKRLHVKRRFSDPNQLDVTFVVARYEGV